MARMGPWRVRTLISIRRAAFNAGIVARRRIVISTVVRHDRVGRQAGRQCCRAHGWT